MPIQKKPYTVSKVNQIVSAMFADEALFSSIAVTGEVSNLTYHRSGHIYFSLKDEKSVLSAVMFRSYTDAGLRFKMREGDQVTVTGSIEVYEAGGRYQLYARRIEKAGVGDLYLRYEALKKKLEEEGMFDSSYKQPIPPYGLKIGVITAPTGAVIHDIIQNARRRNPYVSITLCPVRVQGEGAAEEIADAIARMDVLGFDTLIVGRGGGSLEDLWAFNEEIVARQIFASRTPIISAVGHETDFALSDFVADARASTPTAAAELAVFSYDEFKAGLSGKQERMAHSFYLKSERVQREIERDRGMLARLSPASRVREMTERLKEKCDALDTAMERRLSLTKGRLPDRAAYDTAMEAALTRTLVAVKMRSLRPGEVMTRRLSEVRAQIGQKAAVLDGLSPLRTLSAGYSYVSDERGRNVKEASALSAGDILTIRFAKGQARTKVLETENETN